MLKEEEADPQQHFWTIYRIAWESEDRDSWRELVMSATTPNSDDRDGDR